MLTRLCLIALLRDVRRIKVFLKKSDLEKLIHAIISHRLDYCNVIFNNMNKENLNKLQKCQNAAAKVIVSPSHSSAVERLKELHWLPIESRVVYKF